MTKRDPQAYAASQSGTPKQAPTKTGSWQGYCMSFVSHALTGHASGYTTANLASAAARSQPGFHKDGTPPANAPVYWTTNNKGHAALSAGGGFVWTTDYAGPGTVSKQSLADVTNWLGSSARYQGWSAAFGGTNSSPTQVVEHSVTQDVKDGLSIPNPVQWLSDHFVGFCYIALGLVLVSIALLKLTTNVTKAAAPLAAALL